MKPFVFTAIAGLIFISIMIFGSSDKTVDSSGVSPVTFNVINYRKTRTLYEGVYADGTASMIRQSPHVLVPSSQKLLNRLRTLRVFVHASEVKHPKLYVETANPYRQYVLEGDFVASQEQSLIWVNEETLRFICVSGNELKEVCEVNFVKGIFLRI